jgi:hypothetical protein
MFLKNTWTTVHRTFLHMLRVMEAALPPLVRGYAGTGRKPYLYQPFIRSVRAKCFFKIDTTTELIQRIVGNSNLRLLRGFDTIPGKSTFSRKFAELSETTIMSETPGRLVKEAHEGKVACHVSRDSTATEAREAEKGGKQAAERRNGH